MTQYTVRRTETADKAVVERLLVESWGAVEVYAALVEALVAELDGIPIRDELELELTL